MLGSNKLFEKMLYWGPLFVGVVFLCGGLALLRGDLFVFLKDALVAQKLVEPHDPVPILPDGASPKVPFQKNEELPPFVEKNIARKAADHLPSLSAQLGHDGGLVQLSMMTIGAHSGQQFVRQRMQDWGDMSGRLGLKLYLATQAGMYKSAALPVKRLVFERSSFLGGAAEPSRVGVRQAAQSGQHFMLFRVAQKIGARGAVSADRFVILNAALDSGKEDAGKGALDEAALNFSRVQLGRLLQPHRGLTPVLFSQTGAKTVALHYHLNRFSSLMGGGGLTFAQLGLSELTVGAARFAKQAELLVGATPLESVRFQFPSLEFDEGPRARSCSERYYSALQYLYSNYIQPLKANLKPVFQMDRALPGKWVFHPPRAKSIRVCQRRKIYRSYSGKRRKGKCLKWGRKVVASHTPYLSKEERQFFQFAKKLVIGKGRRSDMKPRSPNHWVINRVTKDLNTYAKQKQHPALCTGAIRMVDYFEGNLGRVKGMVEQVHQLTRLNDALLEARRLYLEDLLNLARKSDFLKQSLSEDITGAVQNNKDPSARVTRALTETNQAINLPPPISLARLRANQLQVSLAELSAQILGPETGQAVAEAPNVFAALKLVRARLQHEGPIISINALGLLEMKRLFGLIEASYYIQHASHKLLGLRVQLFGTLSGLRQAHQTYCQCGGDGPKTAFPLP